MQPPTIIRIKDVYGKPYYVALEDVQSNRTQIPLRHPDGRKFSDSASLLKSGKPVSIHRDNIAC